MRRNSGRVCASVRFSVVPVLDSVGAGIARTSRCIVIRTPRLASSFVSAGPSRSSHSSTIASDSRPEFSLWRTSSKRFISVSVPVSPLPPSPGGAKSQYGISFSTRGARLRRILSTHRSAAWGAISRMHGRTTAWRNASSINIASAPASVALSSAAAARPASTASFSRSFQLPYARASDRRCSQPRSAAPSRECATMAGSSSMVANGSGVAVPCARSRSVRTPLARGWWRCAW